MSKKIAVVLYNLGGPDGPESIKPFLFNLFNDPAIIKVPQPFRFLIAKLISSLRHLEAKKIYAHLGGGSPILANTQAQAMALENALNQNTQDQFRVYIAMRHWHPRAKKVVQEIKQEGIDHIISLPLYPQFSTTTTGSSFLDFDKELKSQGVDVSHTKICCYPKDIGFAQSIKELIEAGLGKLDRTRKIHVLFSAHGLPERVIKAGDPYQFQVEKTVAGVLNQVSDGFKAYDIEYLTCYQSRVGPLKWIGPSTVDEIKRAGQNGAQVLIVPIAFVSEHSETLVEIDMEFKELARASGVTAFIRVPTVSVRKAFIDGLKGQVLFALAKSHMGVVGPHICPKVCIDCPLVAQG